MSENTPVLNSQKKLGRPKKYATKEEAYEVQKRQHTAYKNRKKEREFQFNASISKSQAELLKILLNNVIDDEPLLEELLSKVRHVL